MELNQLRSLGRCDFLFFVGVQGLGFRDVILINVGDPLYFLGARCLKYPLRIPRIRPLPLPTNFPDEFVSN